MKDINRRIILIAIGFSFSIIFNLQGQNWYTVVTVQASLGACGNINHMGGGFSYPSPFTGGGFTCQTCSGSYVTMFFNGKALSDSKITSFNGRAGGAIAGWKDGQPFDYCSSLNFDNVYVTNSGSSSGYFQNNCGGGTCYASVSFSAKYYHYYNFKITDYTNINSVKHPLSLTIPGLDTIKDQSRLSFQVALENSNSWKNINFSKLQIKSGSYFNGTLSYDDIIGLNTEWIGQVLKIRLIQTVQEGIVLESNLVSFKFLNDLEINTITLPECSGKKDGKLSITLISTAYPIGGPYYFDVTLYPYTNGCEGCTGGCVAIGSNSYCLKPFLMQNTGVQSENPYTVTDLPEGSYILEVANGRYSYPAYKIIEIKSNDLSASTVPENINESSYNVAYSGADASVRLDISGGQSPYSYSFDASNYNSVSTGTDINFLSVTGAGTEVIKTIYVKDNNNCVVAKGVPLKIPAPVQVSVTSSSPTCHSSDIGTKDDGTLLVSIMGGIPGYRIYLNGGTTPWTTSGSTYTIPNLSVGSYNIEVKDYANQGDLTSKEIAEPADLQASASITTPNLCYGDQAAITVTGLNGSNYTYSKNQNGSFDDLNVFSIADNQTVNFYVKSGNCIAMSDAVTVPVNPEDITITISNKYNESCGIANNGSVKLDVSKGTSYSNGYDITFGSTISRGYTYENATLNSDTYHYIVKDSRSCTKEGDMIIGFSSNPLSISPTVHKSLASCSNIHDGSLSFSIIPGERAFPPYNYVLTGPTPENLTTNETIKEFLSLQNGNYSLEVTDNEGCVDELDEISLGIIINTLILADSLNTNSTCADAKTGSIGITPDNGFPFDDGYNISLFKQGGSEVLESVRNASHSFNPLFAGNYQVNIEDGKGCIINKNFEVQANPNPVSITFSDVKHQSCKEMANGAFRITASSIGPGNVDYGIASINNLSLSTSANTNTIYYSGTDSLHYAFRAVDTNNCFSEASFDLINLRNNPHPIVLGYDSVACQNDHTGIIRLGVKQKNRQPAYKFYRNGLLNLTDSTFNNLASQFDNIRIVDNEGCPGDTVLQVPVIATSVKFSPEPVFTNAACANASNGTITAAATNGMPFTGGLYKYKISSGDSITAETATFKKLKANTDYVITAIDAKNCIRSSSVIPIRVIDDSLQLRIPVPKNATCEEKSTGSVLVTRVNGDPFKSGFKFSVTDSVGQFLFSKSQPAADSLISLNGFARGRRYTVSVADTNNCSVSQQFNIGFNPLFSTNGRVVSRVRRFGKPEGEVRSVINDGNGRFVYQIYNTDNLVLPVKQDTVKNNILQIDKLYAGNYILKIKDTANCKYDNDEWFEDDIFIQQPEKALALSVASQNNVSCFGESTAWVKLKTEGGYREYAYSLNDTNSFRKDSTFTGLKSGIYKLYVRDSERIDTSIDVTISQPLMELTPVNSITTFTTCYGYTDGSAAVEALGGTPPYAISIDSVQWFNDGVIKDLPAGSYNVHIRDAQNCIARLDNVLVNQPDRISVKGYNLTNTPCLKSEGSISVFNVKGGNSDYVYKWTKENVPFGSQAAISNLRSGSYKLSLLDGMGCLGDTTFFVADLSDIRVNFNTTPVSCWGKANGEAEMTVVKGSVPFKEVQWPGRPTSLYTTTELDSGLHRVVMLDNLGCQKDTVFRITSLSEIQVSERWITDPLCLGNHNGEITVNASGGNGDYRYNWAEFGSGSNVDHLAPGTYRVSVTDANNCEKVFDISLAYSKEEKPNLGKDMQLCSKSDYILNPAGYVKYYWRVNNNTISTEPAIIVTEPGDYIVNVESEEGCIGSDTVNITYGADTMLADFLLTTKAYVGDTIMLVEISRPLPDSVSWFLASGTRLIDYGKYYKQIALTDTGIYEFAMISYYKGCADMVQKYVQVVYPDAETSHKSAKADLIQSVLLFPNPNSGQFSVDIKLSGKADVLMRLINLGTGTTESMRVVKGSDIYTERYNLRLSPGLYTLYIQAGSESRIVNIVVL